MYNLHLNGDIVRCPDIKEIQRNLSIVRENHKICQFGVKEFDCKEWNDFQLLNPHQRLNKRCFLCSRYKVHQDIEGFIWKEYECKKAQKRWNNSLKPKHFSIDNNTYRKISSAAHFLVKKSKYKTLFITLTFPKFKTKPNERKINSCFSNFVDNLTKNYHCQGYIAVRERGETFGRYHFHLLCSIRYYPFNVLNNAWCSAISDISETSLCALRTRKKKIFIKNARYAVRYACKYFAKSKGIKSDTRIVFISNRLIKEPVKFDNENNEFYTCQEMLNSFKSVTSKQTSDFTTMFRINDHKEFDVFCETVLYKLFNLDDKNEKTYIPGFNSS